jgi:hypothetical protein
MSRMTNGLRRLLRLGKKMEAQGTVVVPPAEAAWRMSSLLSDVLDAGCELQRRPRSLAAQVAFEAAQREAQKQHADIIAGLLAWEASQS